MKKLLFLMAALCMFTVASFAQKADYAGTWTLDKAKSTMDERMRARIESITMTVAQTEAELKVTTATKQAPPPADAPARPAASGQSTMSYDLSGRETKIEVDGPNGKMPVSAKANVAGGKLSLSSSRTFNTPNGEMTQITKETWELSPDGKTLTVNREQSSPRGSNTSTLVFTKS